jgi:hypothetical protein
MWILPGRWNIANRALDTQTHTKMGRACRQGLVGVEDVVTLAVVAAEEAVVVALNET